SENFFSFRNPLVFLPLSEGEPSDLFAFDEDWCYFGFQTISFSWFGALATPRRSNRAFINVSLPISTVNPLLKIFFRVD
ncbi:MAG TPA: hypothetical protein V6C95_20540, partial [Coleofasciculaceae cyanobacterium]